MAYFECDGKKSINIEARSQTPARVLLKNILDDRDIHELVWNRKKDVLLIAGLNPNESRELVKFIIDHPKKEIQIGD